MDKIIKMDEIAKKAGVSQSTVSRVINGNKTVNHELREKVMKVIRELDYQPNATAQSLARKKSFLVGVVLPDLANPFFSNLLNLIESDAKLNGYNIIFCNSEGNDQVEKQDIKSLKSRQVDGIIMCPVNVDAKYLESLKQVDIPIVMIATKVDGFDSVSTEHTFGGELMGKYFANKGYRRVGFIGNKNDDKYIGFRRQLDYFGVEFAEEYYIECFDWNQLMTHEMHRKLEIKLRNKTKLDIDALFCYNDMAALGAINVLNTNGFRVPDDISVSGFDNTYLSYEIYPNITTIAQPVEEIVRISMEKLLMRIENKESANVLENIVLNPKLIARTSTK